VCVTPLVRASRFEPSWEWERVELCVENDCASVRLTSPTAGCHVRIFYVPDLEILYSAEDD